ncbi:hypothetical protein ANANG_G00257970 [Anguilla anguilla]|uniref:Phosphorylated adapter RNA export protein n=1 Tax=Anguilla anguilla TaxID=7936 RepID=A0A9D3RNJ3_ANGAN|nr:hypothetical protein ANANG_G00257970 [Anguilla anguilla]
MAAVSGDRMDDLEDGEISGSDSDSAMGVAGDERAQKPTVMAFSGHAFQSREPPRQTAPPVAAGYRSTAAGRTPAPAARTPRRRRRCGSASGRGVPTLAGPAPLRRRAPPLRGPGAGPEGEQHLGLGGAGAEPGGGGGGAGHPGNGGEVSMSSRQCETYNYVLARKLMEKEREQEAAARGHVGQPAGRLHAAARGRMGDGDGGGEHKRKRPTKERLGPRAMERGWSPRAEMDVHRLREPKKDLMERVVRTIGKKKAIELLAETATVEQNGGILTVDGSRRRTPGGVYLNLLKNTPSITGKQVKEIFYDENQRDYSSKKAAKKRRRHELCKKMKQAINALDLQEHDDGSRETFASDTNEALESLEDAAEPDPPQPPPDFALGTEDAAVVYNSSDLEVF